MDSATSHFLKPSPLETLMNRCVGVFARLGIGPAYLHLLEVRGRKTGRVYSTPVNLLKLNGHEYLVGGRGHTAWSRNASAGGEVILRRGRNSQRYRVVPVPEMNKPPILRAYLQEYSNTVQRFFSVPANSPVEAFATIADRHPVFELKPIGPGAS